MRYNRQSGSGTSSLIETTDKDLRSTITSASCEYDKQDNSSSDKCVGDVYKGDGVTSSPVSYFKKLRKYCDYSDKAYLYANKPPDASSGIKVFPAGTIAGKYSPSYFVAKEDAENRIIICIKGTSQRKDVVADLKMIKFKDITKVPTFHEAMMSAAMKILFQDELLENYIKPAIKENKKIRFVGHSLGGGVATYLTLILVLMPVLYQGLPKPDIHAYVYGCPSIMPRCFSSKLEPYITSVVHDNDTVCRVPPFKNLVVPGNSKIIHIVDCKDTKHKVFIRHWRFFKKGIIGLSTQVTDHLLDAYLGALDFIIKEYA